MRKARVSRKMRSTTVSRVMPMPPRICSERSATRAIAPEQITLDIELSFEARFPLVEQPGGVPDRQPRQMDVHCVVGQHERYALVLAELRWRLVTSCYCTPVSRHANPLLVLALNRNASTA